jgi:hypothetical protein
MLNSKLEAHHPVVFSNEEEASAFLLNITDDELKDCAIEGFLPDGNVWVDKWIALAEVVNRHFQDRAIFTLEELINLKIVQEFGHSTARRRSVEVQKPQAAQFPRQGSGLLNQPIPQNIAVFF